MGDSNPIRGGRSRSAAATESAQRAQFRLLLELCSILTDDLEPGPSSTRIRLRDFAVHLRVLLGETPTLSEVDAAQLVAEEDGEPVE